jgi:hypothetical protein
MQLPDFGGSCGRVHRNARQEAPGSICARYAGNGILEAGYSKRVPGFVLSG